MRVSGRTRDFVVAGMFLTLVAALVTVGWADREAGVELEYGPLAPSLELPRIDGGTATLGSYRGRPVIVNIWATWCPPCVREMPSLQRVYERFGDDGLAILAVAVDDRPGVRTESGRIEGLVSQFVAEYGLTFPVVVDPTGETERRFETEYLPTTILIDREGRIRVKEIGGRTWDEPPFLDMVEALMEEG